MAHVRNRFVDPGVSSWKSLRETWSQQGFTTIFSDIEVEKSYSRNLSSGRPVVKTRITYPRSKSHGSSQDAESSFQESKVLFL